ncbi:MAG: hypothetical protein IKA31_01580 [Clostridia bacterium]|nr:hypothetical protein [Clostridia bacterium]
MKLFKTILFWAVILLVATVVITLIAAGITSAVEGQPFFDVLADWFTKAPEVLPDEETVKETAKFLIK